MLVSLGLSSPNPRGNSSTALPEGPGYQFPESPNGAEFFETHTEQSLLTT